MQVHRRKFLLGIALFSGALLPALTVLVTPLFALGEYSRGRKIIRLIKFESRGLLCESWEGIAEEAHYDSREKCDPSSRECYTPTVRRFKFSVNKDNARAVNFMRKNIDREMLVVFKHHRIEPLCMSTDYEIQEVYAQQDAPPSGFQRKLVVRKTGSRNYSLYGRFLRLEYVGTTVGTFEGLYLDARRRKVHSFSITDRQMARYASNTMFFRKSFYFGISRAIVKGLRRSSLDIFEINYDEQAGGVEVAPTKTEKKDK